MADDIRQNNRQDIIYNSKKPEKNINDSFQNLANCSGNGQATAHRTSP